MGGESKFKRSQYFIDARFQIAFIARFCLITVLASALIVFLIYYFNRQTTTVAFENLKVVVKSTADFILPMMLQIMIGVTLLVGIATVAVALFTSHKIAGPLYRIKTDLDKFREGDLRGPIRVRGKDQAQKLALSFEEMRVEMKNSISLVKKEWDSIRSSLVNPESKTQDEEEKKALQASIERIDSELSKFKVD